jgi:hypothetical protein
VLAKILLDLHVNMKFRVDGDGYWTEAPAVITRAGARGDHPNMDAVVRFA